MKTMEGNNLQGSICNGSFDVADKLIKHDGKKVGGKGVSLKNTSRRGKSLKGHTIY